MRKRALLSFGAAWFLTLMGGASPLFPYLTATVAFFWFLYCPRDLPWPYVMGTALLEGAMGRIPFIAGGMVLYSILYVGTLVMRHYLHARSFSLVWFAFSCLIFLMAVLDGFFYLRWGAAAWSLFGIKALMTCLWFPIVWRLQIRIAAIL